MTTTNTDVASVRPERYRHTFPHASPRAVETPGNDERQESRQDDEKHQVVVQSASSGRNLNAKYHPMAGGPTSDQTYRPTLATHQVDTGAGRYCKRERRLEEEVWRRREGLA